VTILIRLRFKVDTIFQVFLLKLLAIIASMRLDDLHINLNFKITQINLILLAFEAGIILQVSSMSSLAILLSILHVWF
jgi:hypothetical protein